MAGGIRPIGMAGMRVSRRARPHGSTVVSAAYSGLSMLSMPRARLMLMARAPPAVPISVPRPPKAQSAHLTALYVSYALRILRNMRDAYARYASDGHGMRMVCIT